MSINIGDNTKIYSYVNLIDGCSVGDNCSIGAYTEVGRDVSIGNRCKIQAKVFIPKGVFIEDDVFIGPGVTFINDRYPSAKKYGQFQQTYIKKGANIGAASTILCGITLGEGCTIGAGSVVIKDVEAGTTVVGNPAREVVSNE